MATSWKSWSRSEAADERLAGHRRQELQLAPAHRHRQVQGLRRDARRRGSVRGANCHGRNPAHQYRPDAWRAEPARFPAAVQIHLPAEHRRLLYGAGRGAHAAPCARAARRARAGEARGAGRSAHAVPEHARDAEGGGRAGEGRLQGDGVLLGRPDPGADARSRRLRGGDAARLAHRFWHGHPQSLEPAAGHRQAEGSGAGRCRRRHRLGCRGGDGAWLRWRADEHGGRGGEEPGADGEGDEESRGSGPRSIPCRAHAEEALLGGAQLSHRRHDLVQGSLKRPIRSYVLRQGRTTPAQSRALEQLYPRYGIPVATRPIAPYSLFARVAPLVLEIGSGMGETTVAIAKAHPEADFIAVEVHGPGVGSLLNAVEREQLGNLRVIRHDAVEVLQQMIGDQTLAALHLFFPDPWPKKRHHKRRLVQPDTASLMARKLALGGVLHAATDWPEYADHMERVFAAEPLLERAERGFTARPETKFASRG